MSEVIITKDNFEKEVINSDIPVLVDFYADWCGPCKMLAPVLEEVSEEFTDQVSFYNVDVDDEEELAAKYGIMNIPAVLVMKDGVKQGMLIGFKAKDVLKSEIEKLI